MGRDRHATSAILDFYNTLLSSYPLPQDVIEIDLPAVYADAQTFSDLNIQTKDTLAAVWLTLKTYQDLLRFHLKRYQADPASEKTNDAIAALIHTDLRRMNYLLNKNDSNESEKLYEEALIHMSWGGLYWQYFEQLDQITSTETNLKINKQLFLRTLTAKGEELHPINNANRLKVGASCNNPTSSSTGVTQPITGNSPGAINRLKVGDLVRVRMELRADRDYEYVHLKDMHASGFEPVSTFSGHLYQDGLWYYESVKNASTNFFITSLRKGVYVFEYDLHVTHAGDFSNGITTFSCMYAPEFSAHSEGFRVQISEL